jgi:hypothetical protein
MNKLNIKDGFSVVMEPVLMDRSSLACYSEAQDQSTCALHVHIVGNMEHVWREVAVCGGDCHELVLFGGEQGTIAYFTGCQRVRKTLEIVFGEEELTPVDERNLPPRGNESRSAGIYFRTLRWRVGEGLDVHWEILTPAQVISLLQAADELVVQVDETGRPIAPIAEE